MAEQHGFKAIEWHLFLNTPEPQSAERVISRLEKLLGVEIETVSLREYWKDPSLTDAVLRSQIDPVVEPAEAIYRFMLAFTRLAHGFSTAGPQFYEGGAVEFSALASGGFIESGVHWMEASIRNFESGRPQPA